MRVTGSSRATDVVGALLKGTVLDSIRIYSLIVQLGFFRSCSPTDLPSEVWLTVSGGLSVVPSAAKPEASGEGDDFFSHRAIVISELYKLIGREVSAAFVSDVGTLDVVILGRSRICAQSDNDDLEEVWTVTSDSPDAARNQAWYVALDDGGSITVRSPS